MVEVLIATVVLSTTVVAMAGLMTVAGVSIRNARRHSVATLMALGKLAELRVQGGTVSPAGTLASDVEGFVDYLDAGGRVLARSGAKPRAAVFVRRWRIRPLPEAPLESSIIEVLVTPGEGRVATLSTRALGPS